MRRTINWYYKNRTMSLRRAANRALLVHLLSLKCKATSKALILSFVFWDRNKLTEAQDEAQNDKACAQLFPVEKKAFLQKERKKVLVGKRSVNWLQVQTSVRNSCMEVVLFCWLLSQTQWLKFIHSSWGFLTNFHVYAF